MKIYTKTGDTGTTSLYSKQDQTFDRVSKSSLVIKGIGLIDECNACVGLAISFVNDTDVQNILKCVQNDLFCVSAELAARGQTKHVRSAQVEQLESMIDTYEDKLPKLTKFILPTGKAGSSCHLARTQIRRAERCVVKIFERTQDCVSLEILAYMNRVSDLMFVLSRFVNQEDGVEELSPTY